MKKILYVIQKVLSRFNYVFYVGSSDILPEPLSKEEEVDYVLKSMKGDVLAKNKLIEHNLRLVVFLAKKYENTNIDLEDLVSIGTIGLIKGIDSYSLKHGTKITTYCARCIENEILMYFRSNKKNNMVVSLDEPIGFDKDGNEVTILEVLKTPKPDYIDEISKKDNIGLLKKYLNILNPREKEIIKRRYGLDNLDEQTQKEIAKDLNISRSYVSRIEKRATTKILREFLKENKI